MARGMFNYPQPTKEKGQRSIDIADLFLTRLTPPWARPSSFSAYQWRAWVLNQPVAIVCRETLIANLLSLDWKITPRNSKYQEELEPTIKYYTRLFTKGGDYGSLSLDYSGLVEWVSGDLLDTPFGAGAEIGRRGDVPGGRVAWIRPLDAGTLYPTLNDDYPVVQYWTQPYDAVAFPRWSIARTYMSPHSYIYREGWGMPPPEKIYFALELLNRGDKYYANLLLDIPTAGILDLGDMEKDAAEEWVTAFKTFVQDQNVAFRVPVLYEHNNPIEWIPFGKVPNDIMFDKITMKYAALVAAAYGMSLSDIGLQTTSASGETLAGSIRQERRTRKTGHSRVKAKVKSFFDSILPDTLEFNFIDYDDELNVALGRARLASSQAFTAWRQMGIFSAQEIRSQAIQDGLVSVSLPDEIPPDAKPDPTMSPNGEPELLQGGKAPSAGGEGEVKSLVDSVSFKAKTRNMDTFISNVVNEFVGKFMEALSAVGEDEVDMMKSMITDAVFSDEDSLLFSQAISRIIKNRSLGTFSFGNLESELEALLGDDVPDVDIKSLIGTFKENLKSHLPDFIGRAVVVTMLESDMGSETFLDDIKSRITSTLNEYISAYVRIETRSILAKARDIPSNLPEIVKVRSLGKGFKVGDNTPQFVVNVPERETKIDVHVPEKSVTVNVPEKEVNVIVPKQETPIVNISSPNVHMDAPIVNVPKQDAPIVNVSVPEQSAPVVNVRNEVSPTPVEITNPVTVNVPKAIEERQIVIRDQWGNISATDKEIIYEDDEGKKDEDD